MFPQIAMYHRFLANEKSYEFILKEKIQPLPVSLWSIVTTLT